MRSDTVRTLASLRVRDVTAYGANARHFPDLPSSLSAFDSLRAKEGVKEDVRFRFDRILNR